MPKLREVIEGTKTKI